MYKLIKYFGYDIFYLKVNVMDTKDEKGIKGIKTDELIKLYKEVDDFISFLDDEHKKNTEES